MDWMEQYPKAKKPAYSDLLEFFPEDIRGLFLRFNQAVNERYRVWNKYHRFSKSTGWTYGFGRLYNVELLTVSIHGKCFEVFRIPVRDEESLGIVLQKAQEAYDQGFEERYAATCHTRRRNQIERSKKRVERETAQMEQIATNTDPAKLNQFHWRKKVSRADLRRLYQCEAAGLPDQELLDEIGFTIYARCVQAKEAREHMEKGRILCHHCGTVVAAGHVSPTGAVLTNAVAANAPIACPCGYSYTYREYRRSCNAANMPGGRATPTFEHFMQKWPACKSATDKMLLIDWLVHECHVTLMSGEEGRSVCANLIEGTKKQLTDLIEQLAYGS